MDTIDKMLENVEITLTKSSNETIIHITCKYCGAGNKFVIPVYQSKCIKCRRELLKEEGIE